MPKLVFWTWLFKGLDDNRAGFFKLFDRWFWVHCLVSGALVYFFNSYDFQEMAKSIIIPASGILLGITFAWSGNITALLGASEISKLSSFSSGGFPKYVYTVQLSILIVFFTTILWIFVATGLLIFPEENTIVDFDKLNVSLKYCSIIKFVLFLFSCLAVRECWQTILFAQYMTICKDAISRLKTHRQKLTRSDKTSYLLYPRKVTKKNKTRKKIDIP